MKQKVVNVQLAYYVEKEGYRKIAACVYSLSGVFLGMEVVKQDPRKPDTGKVKLKISSKRESMLVSLPLCGR